jgi:SAM-dependent methyltransferase
MFSTRDTQSSYDLVAEEYAARIYDELRNKPFDRQVLDRFADDVGDAGLACDMGCGPGHVARYLRERGALVCGVDLSFQMVARARKLNPGIDFTQGNMLALDVEDDRWAGIAAMYSIIHIARHDVTRALRELRRVIKPGGPLLVSFHIGHDHIHRDEWWGQPVNVDFNLFQPEEMAAFLASSGFTVEEILERDPYPPDVEHQSRRAYLIARKPAGTPAFA